LGGSGAVSGLEMPPPFNRLGRNPFAIAACILASNCSPVYSIRVQATLVQPMSVECILNAAQTAEGVKRVLIHHSEPEEKAKMVQAVETLIDPPTVYLVEGLNHDAQIEQGSLKTGGIVFWVGRQGIGIKPSQQSIEREQAWYVKIASHIAGRCKGNYAAMNCLPASSACRQTVPETGPH
jgi:hypothetical protein